MTTVFYSQWFDINNRQIYITMSKHKDFMEELNEFSKTSSGKLTIFVFSSGICDNSFEEVFPNLLNTFLETKEDIYNFIIGKGLDPTKIITKFNEERENMVEGSKIISIDVKDVSQN
jgi:hypothetical protein